MAPPPGEEELLNSTSAPETGVEGGGSASAEAGPGEGYPCPAWSSSSTFYLYDGGTLVATFDASDNVIDMFINGPQGRIASYYQNNNSYLYYYMADHLGSSRVMMQGVPFPQNYQVAEYYNYQPFGQAIESWGSYATPYKFTGKERDQHSTFAFDYFGARFYDPRIGQFSSVDAAGQFASGYVYGGNNPVMGVDPDGNFFFLAAPFLWSLATSVGVSAASYGLTASDPSWEGLARAVGGAALSTTLTGGLASLGGNVAHSFLYRTGASIASSMATNAAMGGGISWQSAIGATAGGLASEGIFGQFRPTGNNRLLNVGEEIAFGAAKGATGGVLGAASTNALFGENRINLGRAMGSGAVSGGLNGAASWAKYGAALKGPSDPYEEEALQAFLKDKGMSRPDFRTGGLVSRFAYKDRWHNGALGRYDYKVGGKIFMFGFADGLDLAGTWIHEATHLWQHLVCGTAGFLAEFKLDEAVQAQDDDNRSWYEIPGTMEYQAQWYSYYYNKQFGARWNSAGYETPVISAF
jgi:RHS repeat-associated protein